MLKYTDYDIVFREIPEEVTLAINLSNCPNRCEGCHSAHLQDNIGDELHEEVIDSLIERYGSSVTCVCFMGGDSEPSEVERLAKLIHKKHKLKTAWYSGRESFPNDITSLDFIKLGAYVKSRGDLRSKTTNQRLYAIKNNRIRDITNNII